MNCEGAAGWPALVWSDAWAIDCRLSRPSSRCASCRSRLRAALGHFGAKLPGDGSLPRRVPTGRRRDRVRDAIVGSVAVGAGRRVPFAAARGASFERKSARGRSQARGGCWPAGAIRLDGGGWSRGLRVLSGSMTAWLIAWPCSPSLDPFQIAAALQAGLRDIASCQKHCSPHAGWTKTRSGARGGTVPSGTRRERGRSASARGGMWQRWRRRAGEVTVCCRSAVARCAWSPFSSRGARDGSPAGYRRNLRLHVRSDRARQAEQWWANIRVRAAGAGSLHEERTSPRAITQLARSSDRADSALRAMPRVWFLLGLAALVPSLVSNQFATAGVAVALGATVLGGAALGRLVVGLSELSLAACSWSEVEPLYRAAARPEIQASPDVVASQLLETGSLERGRDARVPLLDATDLVYAYEGRPHPAEGRQPAVSSAGDRILLEEPSGGPSPRHIAAHGPAPAAVGPAAAPRLDWQTLGPTGWRRHVAVAPQYHESHVLSETLLFNLLMGREWPPSRDDMREAEDVCRALGLGELLARMPAGLFQMVGESGWRLSHGEKSRLYIARALLQRSELVLLDETSQRWIRRLWICLKVCWTGRRRWSWWRIRSLEVEMQWRCWRNSRSCVLRRTGRRPVRLERFTLHASRRPARDSDSRTTSGSGRYGVDRHPRPPCSACAGTSSCRGSRSCGCRCRSRCCCRNGACLPAASSCSTTRASFVYGNVTLGLLIRA